MPGYIIHAVEAERVLENMPMKWRMKFSGGISQEWHDAFLCGVLLPDAAGKEVKAQTHYWDENTLENVIVVPDLSSFLDQYAEMLEQPVVLGYLAHLHLDQLFFKHIFPKKCFF